MEGRTYFKAVALLDGELRSWDNPEGPASLVYEIGERTTPRFGGVLAFPTEGKVRAMLAANTIDDEVDPHWRILRGRGVEVKLPPYRGLQPWTLREVWRLGGDIPYCEQGSWPEGTVALAWFEPEEVV